MKTESGGPLTVRAKSARGELTPLRVDLDGPVRFETTNADGAHVTGVAHDGAIIQGRDATEAGAPRRLIVDGRRVTVRGGRSG